MRPHEEHSPFKEGNDQAAAEGTQTEITTIVDFLDADDLDDDDVGDDQDGDS